MWIIAGPNGSGKTAIVCSERVRELLGQIPYLNADNIAELLRGKDQSLSERQASLEAANMVDSQVDQYIADRTSFAVETVLSSSKYKRRVKAAKSAGFEIGLVFVYLANPNLNLLRVKQRVEEHGHNVPANAVRTRWPRSIKNFGWFANRSTYLLHIDNSRELARYVMEKPVEKECVSLEPPRNPEVERAIQKAQKALQRL